MAGLVVFEVLRTVRELHEPLNDVGLDQPFVVAREHEQVVEGKQVAHQHVQLLLDQVHLLGVVRGVTLPNAAAWR